MKDTIICPKCGNEMKYGEIGLDPFFSKGLPLMFWAPEKTYDRMFPGTITAKKAEAEGGMKFRIGNGAMGNRTVGYACKECKCILLDI